tara:strand:+ start:1409 stop:1567 length:159 start_codon:yes stop_codon:yes gene_type:complete
MVVYALAILARLRPYSFYFFLLSMLAALRIVRLFYFYVSAAEDQANEFQTKK